MSGIREITEQTMIDAHKAGMAYWQRNKPHNATDDNLRSLARSCGWHDANNDAWLAGFKGAQRRETNPRVPTFREAFGFCAYGEDND